MVALNAYLRPLRVKRKPSSRQAWTACKLFFRVAFVLTSSFFFLITEERRIKNNEALLENSLINLHYETSKYNDPLIKLILAENLTESENKATNNTTGENKVSSLGKTYQSEGLKSVQDIYSNSKRIPSYSIETPKYPPYTPGGKFPKNVSICRKHVYRKINHF